MTRLTCVNVLKFLAHCFRRRLSVSIVRVYLAGLQNYALEHDIPTVSPASVISRALKGCQRLRPKTLDKRIPITLDIMRTLKRGVFSSSLSSYQQHLFWCAATLAFSGFLRVSEFASPYSVRFSLTKCLLFPRSF